METLNFKDWQKVEMRVGKILKAEDIGGADKLYKLSVDLGREIGKRTLVAGLKEYYTKQELEGKKAVFLVNLEPKTMKGVESQGMILAADDGKRKIVLIEPEKDIEPGALIR